MSIQEHDRVVLKRDVHELAMQAGDVGIVVDVYAGGAGFEVEFCTLTGETIGVVTLKADQVRPVSTADVAHARRRAG